MPNLQEILLAYLTSAEVPLWPGADGLTRSDVVRSYPQAMAAGRVPERERLLEEHPDLTPEPETFLDGPQARGIRSAHTATLLLPCEFSCKLGRSLDNRERIPP